MAVPTNYPFRQALTLALQNVVAAVVIPALNAALTAQYTAQNVPSAKWVDFGPDQVRIGELAVVSEPTVCIAAAGCDNRLVGARTFAATYQTDLILLLPAAADNAPEDFALVEEAYMDAMIDGLTAGDSAFSLNPNLSGSIKPLPTGSNFRECYPVACERPMLDKLSDAVSVVRRCVVVHTATVSYALDRPDSLTTG